MIGVSFHLAYEIVLVTHNIIVKVRRNIINARLIERERGMLTCFVYILNTKYILVFPYICYAQADLCSD